MVKVCIIRETMQVCRIINSVQLYWQVSLKHLSRTSSHACEILPEKVRKALSPAAQFLLCLPQSQKIITQVGLDDALPNSKSCAAQPPKSKPYDRTVPAKV
jgi:hypothetical protein